MDKDFIDILKNGNPIVLATVDESCKPHVIFVSGQEIMDDKIIVTDNYMVKTKNNIINNKNIALLSFDKNFEKSFEIKGEAEYRGEGELLEFVKKLDANKNFFPKGAIAIAIKEINKSA